MHEIPPIAWAIIIFFGLFIVGLNYGLISALRQGRALKLPTRPKDSRPPLTIKNARDLIRKPFDEEQSQLNELAGLVQNLKTDQNHADQEKCDDAGK